MTLRDLRCRTFRCDREEAPPFLGFGGRPRSACRVEATLSGRIYPPNWRTGPGTWDPRGQQFALSRMCKTELVTSRYVEFVPLLPAQEPECLHSPREPTLF